MVIGSASQSDVARTGGGLSRHMISVSMRAGSFRSAMGGAGGGSNSNGAMKPFTYDSGRVKRAESVSPVSRPAQPRVDTVTGPLIDGEATDAESDEDAERPSRRLGGARGEVATAAAAFLLRASRGRPSPTARSTLIVGGQPVGSAAAAEARGGAGDESPVVDPDFDPSGERVFRAASSCDGLELRRLLKAGSPTKFVNEKGRTALHFAAARGQADMVRDLLAVEIDVDLKDKDGRTALLRAAAAGAWEVVILLCEAGADVNATAANGSTTLHYWAGGRGRADAFIALRKAGVFINARTSGRWTPLHVAAARGHTAGVAQLLKAGATVDAVRERGYLPIHDAAANGHGEIVALLISSSRVPVDYLAGDGSTPLLLAAASGSVSACDVLLANGADYRARSLDHETPFEIAMRLQHRPIALRIELEVAYVPRLLLMIRQPVIGRQLMAIQDERRQPVFARIIRRLPLGAFRMVVYMVGPLNYVSRGKATKILVNQS